MFILILVSKQMHISLNETRSASTLMVLHSGDLDRQFISITNYITLTRLKLTPKLFCYIRERTAAENTFADSCDGGLYYTNKETVGFRCNDESNNGRSWTMYVININKN